jgi:hypothetical protein
VRGRYSTTPISGLSSEETSTELLLVFCGLDPQAVSMKAEVTSKAVEILRDIALFPPL